MNIPNDFLQYIEDVDLQKVVIDVFDRLPPIVQKDLSNVVREILAGGIGDSRLGESEGGTTDVIEGNSLDVLEYKIRLRLKWPPPLTISSNNAQKYMVAHEFAHAYLRHRTFLLSVLPHAKYSLLCNAANQLIEDQADLQVCHWGFKVELLAFHREYPRMLPTFIERQSESMFSDDGPEPKL